MMPAARRIGWGLIGCGWVARDFVVPAMVSAPNVEFLAFHDPDPEAVSLVQKQVLTAFATRNLAELFAVPDLQAVYVATPNHLHRSITESAARAGKHVLCEKPMALRYADACQMVAACEASGVVYATAFDQRFHRRHQELRGLIAAGRLGRVTAVRIHYACWTPPDWNPHPQVKPHDHWRVDPARAGGGAFIDLAPHGLDLSQYLLDDELAEVACLFQHRVFDYPVDDGAMLIGRFRSGALLSMNVAYNCPDVFPRRTLEVIGTEAMAICRNTMGQTPGGDLLLINARDGRQETVSVPAAEDYSPFQRGIESFSESLLNGTPFPFGPARDLRTMQILELAQDGARRAQSRVRVHLINPIPETTPV